MYTYAIELHEEATSIFLASISSIFSLQHWSELCRVIKTVKWKKVDTHNGVTLARCKFGHSSRGHAVVKIEGVLAADPPTVYQFLQLSTKEGGKVWRREEGVKEHFFVVIVSHYVDLPTVGLHLQKWTATRSNWRYITSKFSIFNPSPLFFIFFLQWSPEPPSSLTNSILPFLVSPRGI